MLKQHVSVFSIIILLDFDKLHVSYIVPLYYELHILLSKDISRMSLLSR